MAERYFLSEEDVTALKRLIKNSELPLSKNRPAQPLEHDYLPPEMYFVRVPTDGIPAFNGVILGHVTDVEIYRVTFQDLAGTSGDGWIFEATGQLLSDLYNAGTLAYTVDNGWIPVQREKFGEWFVLTRFAAGGSCSGGSVGEVNATDQGFFGNKSWYNNNSDIPGFSTCAFTENVTNLPFGSNHHRVYEQTIGAFSSSAIEARYGSSWISLGQPNVSSSDTSLTGVAACNLIAEKKKLSANLNSGISDSTGPEKTYGWELEAVGTGDGSAGNEIVFSVIGDSTYPSAGYAVTSNIGTYSTTIYGISTVNCCGDEFVGGIIVGKGPGSEATGTGGAGAAPMMMDFKLPGQDEPLPRTLYLSIGNKTIPLVSKYTYKEGWIGISETLGRQDTYILRCPKHMIKHMELIHINHEQDIVKSEGTITDPPTFSVSGNLEYGSNSLPWLVMP